MQSMQASVLRRSVNRRNKIKCSRDRPRCQRCQKSNNPCSYEEGSTANIESISGHNIVEKAVATRKASQNYGEEYLQRPENVQHSQTEGIVNSSGGDYLSWDNFQSMTEFDLDWIFDAASQSSFPWLEMERAPRETLQVPTNSNNSTRPPSRRKGRNASSQMPDIPLLNTANIIPLLQTEAGPGVEDVPETSLTSIHEIPNDAGTRPRRSLLRFESSRLLQSTCEHLVDTCLTLCEQWPWIKLTSVTFPDKATLEYFIDLYFAYFHPVCLPTLALLL